MIDRKVKKLIHKLEKILKKDPRYEENGDDIFKKQIKKIYTENKKDNIQSIPIVPQYNNIMLDGLNINLMPKSVKQNTGKSIHPTGESLQNLSHLNTMTDMVDINTIREVNRMLQEANNKINSLL